MAGYPHPREDSTRTPFEEIVGTVGHECEFSGGEMAPWLCDHGHAPDRRLHCYQCRCDQANEFLIHPTEDGTAHGGEYLIGGKRGVLFGSDTYIEAVKVMGDAIVACRPTVSERVGMHTHVGVQKRNGDEMDDTEKRRLLRNYLALQEQILVLAAGAFNEVRNNGNTVPRVNTGDIPFASLNGVPVGEFWSTPIADMNFRLPGRPTLNFHTNKGTIEFRVWNATRAEWRMVLAGAVSSALVEAACQEREVPGPDAMDLTDHLEGLLTADVIQLIARQRKQFAVTNHL